MADINVNSLVKIGQLQTSLQRVKTELTALDNKNFGDASIADGKIKFFAKVGDTTPIKELDLPAELYLDQVKTTFVANFNFANGNYTGATDPNLDGKPVLVLAVKDNATTPNVTYSFLNMESLVDTYAPLNAGIQISGYSIGAKVSATAGNLLSIANDGLLVGQDDTKVDKVTTAVAGNIVTFGTSGAVVDSGVTFAGDTDINAMLVEVFGS